MKLLCEGKTYRETCKVAHVSPRDIKPIAKEYKRKRGQKLKKRKNPTFKDCSEISLGFSGMIQKFQYNLIDRLYGHKGNQKVLNQ